MITVREFLRYSVKQHSDAIRDLKRSAAKNKGYISPELPEWKSYKAHKRQCSLAIAATVLEKLSGGVYGNPMAYNIKNLHGVSGEEAKKFIEHVKNNVITRKGMENKIKETKTTHVDLELDVKSLENRLAICLQKTENK